MLKNKKVASFFKTTKDLVDNSYKRLLTCYIATWPLISICSYKPLNMLGDQVTTL